MNPKLVIAVLITLVTFQTALSGSYAVEKKDIRPKYPRFIGFIDKNRDGINDRFHDANGNGINGVTNKKYSHRFRFVDKNKDKINDVFIDKDGDGVNDLETEFVDEDKDGINDNVLDYDRDGVNDITGLRYSNKDLMGYRYGFVEEENKRSYKEFIDRDGDGMHDPIARRRGLRKATDQFVDEDGDGICDGRRFGRRGHGMMRGHGLRSRREKEQ